MSRETAIREVARIHVRGYVDAGHATWYQAASDKTRAQHLRASHWPAWRYTPEVMTAQDHADFHAKYQDR